MLSVVTAVPEKADAAIATYERVRSRTGMRYRADVNKMIPFTTVVLGLLAFLLFAGLYLDITNPL